MRAPRTRPTVRSRRHGGHAGPGRQPRDEAPRVSCLTAREPEKPWPPTDAAATPAPGSVISPSTSRPPSSADEEPWASTHVVKTLWPPCAGTQRWRRRFGAALVCVRYRHDARRDHRYTTVELMVDHAPVRLKRGGRRDLELEVPAADHALRQALLGAGHGAEWDPSTRVWRLSTATARRLGVLSRTRRRPGR